MSTFELSPYQQNILNFIKDSNSNLLVDAKAGSGKTSTLIMMTDEIIKQNKKALFLAFNKSIVQELQTKITDENILISTVHSLGLKFIKSYLYRMHKQNYEVEVKSDRNKDIIVKYMNEICYDSFQQVNDYLPEDELKSLADSLVKEMCFLLNFGRAHNINYHDRDAVIETMRKSCNELKHFEDIGMQDFPLVIEKTLDEIKEIFENPPLENGMPHYVIDYTDMIYFPVLYRMNIPYSLKDQLDYVMVDECQDLNVLQQMFIKKLSNGSNKFIFVGDKKQAIYAFAGSDTNSIENLKRVFNTTELPLNICYRCPENIIKVTQSIVPDIEWNQKREDKGIVEFIKFTEVAKNLTPDSLVIARKNKDLVEIYKDFVLKRKIKVKFKNKDLIEKICNEISQVIKEYILRYNKFLNVEAELYKELEQEGISISDKDDNTKKYIESKRKSLIKTNKASSNKVINKSNFTIEYLFECMKEYKLKGDFSNNQNLLTDYFDLILSFIDEFEKESSSIFVKDFEEYIIRFLSGSLYDNVPVLATVHCMKGGEADIVYIYDYPKFPNEFKDATDEEKQQERNLQYVALTRAKKELYLCLIDNPTFDDKIESENIMAQEIVKELLKR